jgi:hypothetical protein
VISPGMAAPEGQALFIHWTERRYLRDHVELLSSGTTRRSRTGEQLDTAVRCSSGGAYCSASPCSIEIVGPRLPHGPTLGKAIAVQDEPNTYAYARSQSLSRH